MAARLDRLQLPRYEPIFASMAGHCQRSAEGRPSYPNDCFGELSLSFVRTVATIATEDDQAIVWGNDLLIDTWQELGGGAS